LEGRNLQDSEREHDIQRRARARSYGAHDEEDEVDQPNEGFDDGRDEVQGCGELAGGEEADFDQGEEDGYACYGDDDCAGGSVGGVLLAKRFTASSRVCTHDLRDDVTVVGGVFDVRVVGVGQHDAAEDEEYSRDDELDDPERDEEAFAPHLLCGGGGHCCCCFDVGNEWGSKLLLLLW
jgi:hypothetical protein